MIKITNTKSKSLFTSNSIKIVNLSDTFKDYQKKESFSTFKALKADSHPSGFVYNRDLTEGEKEYERKIGELQEIEPYLTVKQYVTAMYVIKDEAEHSGDVEDVKTYDNDVDYGPDNNSDAYQIALSEVREMSHEQKMHIIESDPDLSKIWKVESTADSAVDNGRQEQNSSNTASEKEPTNTLTTSSATDPSSTTSNTTSNTNLSRNLSVLDSDIIFKPNIDLLILDLHNIVLLFSIFIFVGYVIYLYEAQFLTDKNLAIHLFILSIIYKLLIYFF